MEPYIGEIRMFAGNFAPRNWAYCNGQLLSINSNQALFSLLGTTYGGDGRTTFGLPDLRGRAPVQQGNGPGLPDVDLGQKFGAQTNTLIAANLPPHTHTVALTGGVQIPVSSSDADGDDPANSYPANTGENFYASTASPGEYMAPLDTSGLTPTLLNTGGSQSINNMQPYLAVNYIIALFGVFPSRS